MSTYWITREPTENKAGWEYGLPPGIKPEQWPRHSASGLPLVHGFTIRVPPEFRAKGSERVALSYFHPGNSESYPQTSERIQALMDGEPLLDSERSDPFFAALASHVAASHPATDVFTDILDHDHAIVWHTEQDFSGARCPRPSEALPSGMSGEAMDLGEPVGEESPLFLTQEEPKRVLIQLGWPLHPVQCSQEDLEDRGFGPLVLEIETDVGGVNYGDGNCQIDLENGLLDWACT